MPVVSTSKDADALTLTLVAEYAVPPERVWQLWVDPRQLERWWGPPTWPATFERHDVEVGGEAHYFMTGPDGEKARGWWRFIEIDEPRMLEFEDGFSDESGAPNPGMPSMRIRVDIAETGSGTRMTTTTYFNSAADMEQLIGMQMEEGLTQAAGQIDAILAG
jgi:uncharacterized protein YndB with AHSA1/START domain